LVYHRDIKAALRQVEKGVWGCLPNEDTHVPSPKEEAKSALRLENGFGLGWKLFSGGYGISEEITRPLPNGITDVCPLAFFLHRERENHASRL